MTHAPSAPSAPSEPSFAHRSRTDATVRRLVTATCLAIAVAHTGCAEDDAPAPSGAVTPATKSAPGPSQQLAAIGQRLYAQHCLICHQADGGGVPWMQPPLAGAEVVTGPAEPLIELTLRGIGPADGQVPPSGDWSQVMAGFDSLSDGDVAAILTHIRTNWGNDAGPIDAATVGSVRRSIAAGGSAD